MTEPRRTLVAGPHRLTVVECETFDTGGADAEMGVAQDAVGKYHAFIRGFWGDVALSRAFDTVLLARDDTDRLRRRVCG